MRAEIAQLQTRLGVTTLYVTHDQVEAMTMGDRVAVLKLGELQQADAPQTLYDRPNNLFVAGFIGSPAMNLADVEVAGAGEDLQIQLGSDVLNIPAEAVANYPRIKEYPGRRVAVGMRPEHFYRPDGGASEGRTLRAEVNLVEALGSEVLVHFQTDAKPVVSEDVRAAVDDDEAFAELETRATGGMQFTARFDPSSPPKLGDTIEISYKTETMHFFDLETGLALRD